MIRVFVFIFSLFLFSETKEASETFEISDTLKADVTSAQEQSDIADVKVQQSAKKTDILIFPNPTSGLVTVRIPHTAKNISMWLFAQNGRCVLNKNLYAPADNLLDIRKLEAGVYMYQIFEDYKKIDAGKLIISR
jgi:hypothetical protein